MDSEKWTQAKLDTALNTLAHSNFGHGTGCSCTLCYIEFTKAKIRVLKEAGADVAARAHEYVVEEETKKLGGVQGVMGIGWLRKEIAAAVKDAVRDALFQVQNQVTPNAEELKPIFPTIHIPVPEKYKNGEALAEELKKIKWEAVVVDSAAKKVAGLCTCPVDVVINTGCKCGGK